MSYRRSGTGDETLKKEMPMGVVIAILVVVVAALGWFGWSRMNRTGLTREQEEKFLKPLDLKPGGQMPAPPTPSGTLGLPPGAPGGAGVPMPPSPR